MPVIHLRGVSSLAGSGGTQIATCRVHSLESTGKSIGGLDLGLQLAPTGLSGPISSLRPISIESDPSSHHRANGQQSTDGSFSTSVNLLTGIIHPRA